MGARSTCSSRRLQPGAPGEDMSELRSWVSRTLSAIEQGSFRQEPLARPVPFDETSWAVGGVSDEALERVVVFLDSLTRRAPMSGPGWTAHTHIIEAFTSDLRREIERREAEGKG